MILSRHRSAPGWLAFFAALLYAGCDSQSQQDDFAAEAARPPDGYTERTVEGETLTEDADDWRTSPFYRGIVSVEPAYPNPVSANFVTVPVTVTQFDAVQGGLFLRARDPSGPGMIALSDMPEAVEPGVYFMTFSPGLLVTKGLHRVFIFDRGSEIVSYGDILLQ